MTKLKTIIISVVLFFGFFGMAESSQAADYYIAQTAQGDGTALTNCTHAKAITWNWTSPNVVAGDIVYLCGTIATPIATYANGILGNPITILFETDAKLSAPTWTNGTAFLTIDHNYITVDGGTNGIIEATDNGTTSLFKDGTKNNMNSLYGISANGKHDLIIRNLTIKNLYDRLADSYDCTGKSNGIYLTGSATNLLIENCRIYNQSRNINMGFSSATSNITIRDNYFTDAEVSINGGPSSAVVLDNYNIYGNEIYLGTKWTGTSANVATCLESQYQAAGCSSQCTTNWWKHTDGLHIFASYLTSNSQITNLKVYNNKMYSDKAGIVSSGYIFLEYGIISPLIYNNISVCISGSCPSLGNIAIKNLFTSPTSTPQIYNNTIIGKANDAGGGTGIYLAGVVNTALAPIIKNNIFSSLYMGIWDNTGAGTTMSITGDYNDFYNIGNVGRVTNAWYSSISNWATHLGGSNESYSTASNPALNSDYTATVSTPTGTPLSSIFMKDYAGATRSVWTMGAYEYASGVPVTDITPPAAPSGLSVQ